MARVTVEDCIKKVPSRFELVVLAARRTRQITAGASPTVERDNDRNPVISLREIAGETISLADLKESLIASYRQYSPMEENEEELEDLLERELANSMNQSSRSLGAGWIPDSSPPEAGALPGGELSPEMASLEAALDAALVGAEASSASSETAASSDMAEASASNVSASGASSDEVSSEAGEPSSEPSLGTDSKN